MEAKAASHKNSCVPSTGQWVIIIIHHEKASQFATEVSEIGAQNAAASSEKIAWKGDEKYHFASTTLNWVSINLRSSLSRRNITCGLPQIVNEAAVAIKRIVWK